MTYDGTQAPSLQMSAKHEKSSRRRGVYRLLRCFSLICDRFLGLSNGFVVA